MKEVIRIENNNLYSCGAYSIICILKNLGYSFDCEKLNSELEDRFIELKCGAIYKTDLLIEIVNYIKETLGLSDLHFEIIEFNNSSELYDLLSDNTKYHLLCYYAFQGFVVTSKKPVMEHGHFGIVYELRNNKVYGSQSNRKADLASCLKGVDIDKLCESCKCIEGITVNWGKYNKCKIEIPKKNLSEQNRCGKEACKFGLNSCRYATDIGMKVFQFWR